MQHETESNVGELGIESIRIAGMKIKDLPMVAGAHAKRGLPLAIDTERQNAIENILNRFPPQRIDYLEARVRECQAKITQLQQTKAEQSKIITDYTGHISMCKYRDEQLEKLNSEDPGEAAQIKDLKKRFPPYSVPAMQQQITQCEEAIGRCNDVIEKEYNSIAELQRVIGECTERDRQLNNLGAMQA